MISLKKYIESSADQSIKALCDGYRTSLTAVGISAMQICPQVGEDFQRGLFNLRDQLNPGSPAEAVTETGKVIEQEVRKWGEETCGYLQQTAKHVKEIMLAVAETTQAVVERDQRYARQFSEFAAQLATIGNLGDLTKVKESLGQSAAQLRSCVEQMVEDSERSVSRLRSELSQYQARLDEVERVATLDPVTGLANRYSAERQIQLFIKSARVFSVAMLDLDNFKQINDLYGHPAGDSVLAQFAAELRSAFRPTDLVCRWGGDEFLALMECKPDDAARRIDQVRNWVNGDYSVPAGGENRKVNVQASIGLASRQPNDTAPELIARADAAMYEQKSRTGANGSRTP